MIRLEDVTLFVRSAALGSFSRAAREVNLLPGQVSAAIQRLERELDRRLFARSTRSLRLTAEGEQYLPYAQEMLALMQAGADSLQSHEDALSGELKIAMPSDIGRNILLPLITDFCHEHPALSVRLSLSDQISDVFRDPVDIAIRYGKLEDSSYVALPLAEDNRRIMVASPAYLDQNGRPQKLEDVAQHHCLPFVMGGHVYDKWTFPQEGMRRQITVKSRLLCDDAEVARRWAIKGMGIAYKSWIDVCEDIQQRRLERVLPDIPGESTPLHLICPHRKQFSPAIRALHGVLRAHLRAMTAQL
ncbi:LysR family transcriptional regulator [Pantoea rodasii]|uniref:LysR family transcriptional regulator n=1 Tax=Pantoea rodasii TaxID=1076549 RepID=A0A2M9W8X5_9GAMM|nr:LysR family transcriptional regulator [Pantoea rodasii]ORM63611.1 LysR family transcriptional regulator [Pantoea rodasii]PJZ03977.1 LysR family transcriptional regulator [Pantoea rodasii]